MATDQLSLEQPGAPTERVRHRDLVSAGSWVVASFVIFSAANYVFSLALSHVLSIPDYGSFGVISSIFLLAGLVATAGFPWMLSTVVARHRGPESAGVRASALSTALIGNTTLGVLSGLLVGFLTTRLVHNHPGVPFVAAVGTFFTCCNAVWLGLYQGERRFPLLAGLRTSDSIIKAVLGVGLAVIGFGLEGAVGGIVAGAAVATLWGATQVRGLGRPSKLLDRSVLPIVMCTAIAQLGFGLLMNMDILAVRALGVGGSAVVGAGYYQAASVLARAPVYVGLALLNTIFPFLASSDGNPAAEIRLLRTVLRVIALVSVPAAVLLLAAPGSAIGVFFPRSYGPAGDLLRINAAASISLLALSVAVLSLQATRGMRSAAAATLPAVGLEIVALLYAVPRYGAEGAAWSLLIAATVGAVLAWVPVTRRWPLRAIMPSARLVGPTVTIGIVAFLLPIHGRLWLAEAAGLGVLFCILAWALGGISARELVPLVPPTFRPVLEAIAAREPGA